MTCLYRDNAVFWFTVIATVISMLISQRCWPNDSITVTVTHHGHLGNFRNKWEYYAHHYIADIYYLLFTIQCFYKLYNTFNISCKSPKTILFHHRAIIVRNNEAIPMSSEFTPESERQRLQYLVSHLCYCPKIIPIPFLASF